MGLQRSRVAIGILSRRGCCARSACKIHANEREQVRGSIGFLSENCPINSSMCCRLSLSWADPSSVSVLQATVSALLHETSQAVRVAGRSVLVVRR